MTTIVRHGAEAHYMRPDRVYRTSVLQPMIGYRPDVDVQAVAREFAVGPVMGTVLDGLRGLGGWRWGFNGGPGPFERLKLRFQAARAAKQARQFMFSGLGDSPGPAVIMGQQIAPQMQSQMVMLAHLMRAQNANTVQGAVAEAARSLRNRRPYTYYYAG